MEKRYIKYNRIRKDVTLIIGAKCSDGVVLISDRRVIEGTDITAKDKIRLLPLGIVIAGAGVGEIIDKFNDRIPHILEERKAINFEAMKKSKPEIPIEEVPYYFSNLDFLEDCEGLLFNLFERYQQHISVLVASGNISEAELSLIDTNSFIASKRTTYVSVGTGSPYANFLLKKMWKKEISMKQMAIIGKFIIELIAISDIDGYVGNGVQIVFVPNVPEDADELKKTKLIPCCKANIDFEYSKIIKNYNDFLDDIVSQTAKK